jgi:hypothetical protein
MDSANGGPGAFHDGAACAEDKVTMVRDDGAPETPARPSDQAQAQVELDEESTLVWLRDHPCRHLSTDAPSLPTGVVEGKLDRQT